MKTLKSKYKQGNTRNKWKIQQCQSEKLYFGYQKDCDNCDGQTYCDSMRFRPFYVEVANRMLVFADTFDNAKEYATKGHGWLIERESVRGMQLNIELEGNYLRFEPVFNSDSDKVEPSRSVEPTRSVEPSRPVEPPRSVKPSRRVEPSRTPAVI